MNTDDERLGDLFRVLRMKVGLTQEGVALATSIPCATFARSRTATPATCWSIA
jgi:hypothetical protein